MAANAEYQQLVAKRVLGTGILLTGALVLSIGKSTKTRRIKNYIRNPSTEEMPGYFCLVFELNFLPSVTSSQLSSIA